MRASNYLRTLVGFGGMLALIGTTQAQPPGAPPAAGQTTPQPTTQPTTRATIAVFNMAAVMKDYGKAKYQVYQLGEERKRLSQDLVLLRGQYVKLQQEIQIQADPTIKEQMQKRMVEMARQIEDKDREINKQLNDKASAIISTLYDEIKTVVDKTAEMNGYHIVFAYPDATSNDDLKNSYLKELKLKPPAAQPFYVARHADITGVVIQVLNTWYPSPPVPAANADANHAPAGQTPPQQNPQAGPGGLPRP